MKKRALVHMGCNVRKRTFGHVRPAMIQISLRIRAVWSESSLGIFWIAKGAIKSFVMWTAKAPIRLRGIADLFEFSLGTYVRRYVFLVVAQNFDLQRRKIALKPYENSEGPDQSAHSSFDWVPVYSPFLQHRLIDSGAHWLSQAGHYARNKVPCQSVHLGNLTRAFVLSHTPWEIF